MRVQSLVGEIGFHVPCGVAKRLKKGRGKSNDGDRAASLINARFLPEDKSLLGADTTGTGRLFQHRQAGLQANRKELRVGRGLSYLSSVSGRDLSRPGFGGLWGLREQLLSTASFGLVLRGPWW